MYGLFVEVNSSYEFAKVTSGLIVEGVEFTLAIKVQGFFLLSLYRKFLKWSEIVYNELGIKNDMTKERRGLRQDVVYVFFVSV